MSTRNAIQAAARRTIPKLLAGAIVLACTAASVSGPIKAGEQGPRRFGGLLAVHPKNPRYFMDGSGKAILADLGRMDEPKGLLTPTTAAWIFP